MADADPSGGYVGIIPARAGSKRLPGKNMREIGGVPMVGYTLRAALGARSLSRVVVTSDDAALLEWTRREGAHQCLARSAELATDGAQTIDVVRDVLAREEAAGRPIAFVVLLQPTSPLRSAQDIDAAIALHRQAPDSALVSVTAVCADETAKWTGAIRDGVFALEDTRAATHTHRLNGAVYVIPATRLLRDGSFLTGDLVPYVMPAERSVDVDTHDDLAEVLKRLG